MPVQFAEERLIILAPATNDSVNPGPILRSAGYDSIDIGNDHELAAALQGGAAAIIADEVAAFARVDQIGGLLELQPDWSDIPVILLTDHTDDARRHPALLYPMERLGNVSILERPYHPFTLVSLVRTALRARRKQYEVRDRIAAQLLAADALKESEAAYARSEAQLRAITDLMPQLVWSTRPDGYHDYYNDAWYTFTGVRRGSTDGDGWNAIFHPDDQAFSRTRWRHSLATGETYEVEYRLRRHDGVYRWMLGRARPVRDEAGSITRWFGTCTDITELVEARQALARSRSDLERLIAERTSALEKSNERLKAEMMERSRIEEALRQAQKMEAIGQLTGGLAHDFNNLLTVVIGNLDSAKRALAEPEAADAPRLSRAIDQATRGALKAASLTQRLLAFSRRQPLAPRLVDVNQLIEGMSDLLVRSLGERVEIGAALGEGTLLTMADPNQLESALLNLAVNARDAMPGGGKLTIETSLCLLNRTDPELDPDMAPGEYVRVRITDDGHGMGPEIVEQAFEPFFTTKDVGHGTGLGLSQVYGFVKQSGGHVTVDSEVGKGTTVTIYMQHHPGEADADQTSQGSRRIELPRARDGETVLVVEDEDDVRAFSTESLRELGYNVLSARDGPSALALLGNSPQVQMLFTDVGLPGGLNGREVADAARALRPDLRVLFATAYAHNAIKPDGLLETGVQLLPKPFTFTALANKIRDMLDLAAGPKCILVVEDEVLIRMLAVEMLEGFGFAVQEAGSAAEAMAFVNAHPAGLAAVMIDVGLPDRKGDSVAAELRSMNKDLPIVIATGYGGGEFEKRFAGDPLIRVVGKPYDTDKLKTALEAVGLTVTDT